MLENTWSNSVKLKTRRTAGFLGVFWWAAGDLNAEPNA
jgi:hypothetical protein